MTKTQKLNTALFSFLLLITGIALYHQLGDFAHLKNADGVLTDMRSLVLWDVRVPRIGLAILTGAGLALAGNAMQGLFQNPLASPGLLGSSAGATAASVLVLYYFSVPFTVLLFGGVAGALASFLLVYAIAKNHGTTMMLLSGLAVNMLLGAAIALLLSNAESPWALAELYRWLQGSLVWAKLDTLVISLLIVLFGLVCLYRERRYVDLLSFGEETAGTMGIVTRRRNHSTNGCHRFYRLNRTALCTNFIETTPITTLHNKCLIWGFIAAHCGSLCAICAVFLSYLHRHSHGNDWCAMFDLDFIDGTTQIGKVTV